MWVVLLSAGTSDATARSLVIDRLVGLDSSSSSVQEWTQFIEFQRTQFESDVQPTFIDRSDGRGSTGGG